MSLRRRLVQLLLAGGGVVAVIGLGAAALGSWIYLPGIGDMDPGIHDASSLPDRITICGRGWTKGQSAPESTLAEIIERSRVDPIVVDTRLFAPCRPGACTTAANGTGCSTVIWVRVDEDAYVSYSLQGGP